MSINLSIVKSAATAAAEKKFSAAVTDRNSIVKSSTVSDLAAAEEKLSKAKTELRKSQQEDAFRAISAYTIDAPIVALSTVGVFEYTDTKRLKDSSSIESAPRSAMFSLSKFATLYPSALGCAMWRQSVYDAVILAAYRNAYAINGQTAAADLISRLGDKVSGDVLDIIKNGKRNAETGELSIGEVQTALIRAMSKVCPASVAVKVDRQSCRWLERSFDMNKVTGNLVMPREEGMIDRFFIIMRHMIGGMALTVETKVEESK